MQITTIGLDIAKNVFQVHGIDAAEKVIVRKQLRRGQMLAFFKALPPCCAIGKVDLNSIDLATLCHRRPPFRVIQLGRLPRLWNA